MRRIKKAIFQRACFAGWAIPHRAAAKGAAWKDWHLPALTAFPPGTVPGDEMHRS